MATFGGCAGSLNATIEQSSSGTLSAGTVQVDLSTLRISARSSGSQHVEQHQLSEAIPPVCCRVLQCVALRCNVLQSAS